MRKYIATLQLLSIFLISWIFLTDTAKATTAFTYCSLYASQGVCQDTEYSLGDFLNALTDRDGYYPDSSFEIVDDTYVSFTSANFTYYIPFWVIEYRFDSDDYSSGRFGTIAWVNYDDNSNLIPDDFEDYAEEFEDRYDSYENTYNLDLWWNVNNKLPVIFDYLAIDNGFLYGRFSPGYDDYFNSNTYNLQINVFAEENAVIGTIAHEMFHAVQHGYVEDSSFLFTNSFGEGTAAMLESKLAGNNDLSYMELDGAMAASSPEQSVFGDNIYCDEYECGLDGETYSSFLWYSYLHQTYGKDIIGKMLEAFSDIEDTYTFSIEDSPYYSYLAISLALEEEGENIIDVYGEFAIKNYEQDEYTDGEFLPPLEILSTYSAGSGTAEVDDDAPELFGSNYIEFETEGDEGYLTVDLLGNSDALFYVSFIPTGKDGTVDRDAIERYYIDYGEQGSMYFPLDENDEVIMVVSPVETTIDSEDIFNDYIFPYSYSFGRSSSIPEDVLKDTESTSSTGSIFSDVDDGDANSTAISYLKDNGIVGGYSDGSFKPENPLNRAELLKILVEGMGYSPDESQYKNCFPDVTTDWYAKYVCYAKEQGWVEGYPDGTFLPASSVNKVEAIKMLLEVFGVEAADPSTSPFTDVNTSEWYAKYVVKAEELGLLEETNSYSPGSFITRGGVSENIYRLLLQL